MKTNPTILLGVTGSIAAYKSADLCSKMVKKGYNVHVMMTEHALKLIGAPTFLSLSRNPVVTDLFAAQEWKPVHISLAQQADMLVIAPATANILAKCAQGIADDVISTNYLSVTCPVLFAPAMNTAMYEHAATQHNIQILRERGHHFVGPIEGAMACGTSGLGHIADVSALLQKIESILEQ